MYERIYRSDAFGIAVDESFCPEDVMRQAAHVVGIEVHGPISAFRRYLAQRSLSKMVVFTEGPGLDDPNVEYESLGIPPRRVLANFILEHNNL